MLDPNEGPALEYIDNATGLTWSYRGHNFYLYQRKGENLEKLVVSQDMAEPPERTYRLLFWQQLVKDLFSRINPWLDRIRIGLLFAIMGVLLFFIYLIITSYTG